MIVDALMDIAQRTHPENPRHVPSLILLLTHIRQAGERGIAYFQSLKREGCVTFCDLLTEMLDAHNSAAAAAASAAATTSAVTATVTMPSTSSVGVDQKNISPQQLAMGGTLITKRGSQEDNMNPYVQTLDCKAGANCRQKKGSTRSTTVAVSTTESIALFVSPKKVPKLFPQLQSFEGIQNTGQIQVLNFVQKKMQDSLFSYYL